MERRISRTKSIKSLFQVVKVNMSVVETATLPIPSFAFEDVLASQLQVTEVMHNCIPREDCDSISFDDGRNDISYNKRKPVDLHHKCSHDVKFTPLWHTFTSLDRSFSGKAKLGRLLNLSADLACVLGEDHPKHLTRRFENDRQVLFSEYKQYILDTIGHKTIEAEKLISTCWLVSHRHYLNTSLVSSADPVERAEQTDAVYWLFCIFNKLCEPDTYPPSMDYEEIELLLRKLLAWLGLNWDSTKDESTSVDDNDKSEESELPSPIMVTFDQFLSVISDTVEKELAKSTSFRRAVQQLCLIEFQEVIKASGLMVRKAGSDVWKKRWVVLQESNLICYASALCNSVKEVIALSSNMRVEALPGGSPHKHRFRIAENEGFNVKCEHEFSDHDSQSSQSWIALISITIRLQTTGMSTKTSERCERRLERIKRRESEKDVYRKKQDVLRAFEMLQSARKMQTLIEERLTLQAQQRQKQEALLFKMNRIYEDLECIQFKIRLHKQEERKRRLEKLLQNYKESLATGGIIEDIKKEPTEHSKILSHLQLEKSHLEFELKNLRQHSVGSFTLSNNPVISVLPRRMSTTEHFYDSFSSSENLSTTSTDYSLPILPE